MTASFSSHLTKMGNAVLQYLRTHKFPRPVLNSETSYSQAFIVVGDELQEELGARK